MSWRTPSKTHGRVWPVLLAYAAAAVLVPAVANAAPILERRPRGAVNDFAGVLSDGTGRSLEGLSRVLLTETGVSLVVVTTRSLGGESIDEVASKLYERWGIGRQGQDEGVLVLVAVEDRRIRIETGYGAEGYVTDARASGIIREVARPSLAQGRWDEGISATAVALGRIIAKEKELSLEEVLRRGTVPARRQRGDAGVSPVGVLFFVLAMLLLVGTRPGRAILPWLIIAGMGPSRRSSGGFGGGFGGGGFGGGFGGFGGGMSGGGGASGRF